MRKDEFPIIDKHVQNEINAVLDKIRAEIEQIDAPKDYPYDMVTECVKAEVLQIIDKYTK